MQTPSYFQAEVAPVERIGLVAAPLSEASELVQPIASERPATPIEPVTRLRSGIGILASPEDPPKTSYPVVQTLFLLLQLMYFAFYVGALANLAEIQDLLSPLPRATQIFGVLVVTVATLIPVRAFVLCMTRFHAPGAREKFMKIWRFLLPLDELWALSPFLLLHHINVGLALSCTALLVYSPFAQRSLVLMGAGQADRNVSTTAG